MVSEQKIVFWVVGPKFFQDSEVCFMVRGQVNSGEEKVMSIYSGDVSGDVYGDQAAPPQRVKVEKEINSLHIPPPYESQKEF